MYRVKKDDIFDLYRHTGSKYLLVSYICLKTSILYRHSWYRFTIEVCRLEKFDIRKLNKHNKRGNYF